MSKSRDRLKSSRLIILRLFDYRCVLCGSPTRQVHEIVPLSHGKMSIAGKNQVPLCTKDHVLAHGRGTRHSILLLQDARKRFLEIKWKSRPQNLRTGNS